MKRYHGSIEIVERPEIREPNQMTDRKITSENLYLILPGKVSKMAMMYAADFGLPITEALRRIYQSETYRQLEDESTKLWHYGPVALYQIFLEQN